MSLAKRKNIILQSLLIFYWFITLLYTDSYYGVYLIVGICSLICFYVNIKDKRSISIDKKSIFLYGCACLFSLLVTFANYAMFIELPCPDIAGMLFRVCYKGLSMFGVFIGGVFVFGNILIWLKDRLDEFYWTEQECSRISSGGGV